MAYSLPLGEGYTVQPLAVGGSCCGRKDHSEGEREGGSPGAGDGAELECNPAWIPLN